MAVSQEALEKQITALWEGRDDLYAVLPEDDARAAVHQAIELLDSGEARVAELVGDEVVVHEWLKYAVLLLFRLSQMETTELGPFEYADKIPLKRHFQRQGVRVVPGRVGPLGLVPRPRRGDDAELREHRGPRRRRHAWSTPGRRSARARRSASACTCPEGSASVACSSRRRPRR